METKSYFSNFSFAKELYQTQLFHSEELYCMLVLQNIQPSSLHRNVWQNIKVSHKPNVQETQQL